MNQLSEEKILKVSEKLSGIYSSLRGMGGLLTQVTGDPHLNGEDLHGLGIILKELAREILSLENILQEEYGKCDGRETFKVDNNILNSKMAPESTP